MRLPWAVVITHAQQLVDDDLRLIAIVAQGRQPLIARKRAAPLLVILPVPISSTPEQNCFCFGTKQVCTVNARVSAKHVVIVGGGFTGLACTRKLSKSDDVRITLIDKNNYNQFQPLLYQLATAVLGTDDVATSLHESFLGQANVEVKMCEVTAADPKTRMVTTRDGTTYQGDFLVLAAGSQASSSARQEQKKMRSHSTR